MAGVNMPGQRRGLLDQVAQGISIARDIYGIKTAMDESDRRAELHEQQLAEAKAKGPMGQWIETVDAKGSPVREYVVNAKAGDQKPVYIKPPTPKEQKPQELMTVDTVDGKGNPVTKIVPKVAGAEYAKPNKSGTEGGQKTPAQVKSDNETNYRYTALKQNAVKLKDLVKKVGTMEVAGPEASDMDKAIYEMALDYAKLVDPDSVAREGEVAAAKKYMLPFRDYGGATTRNETALEQIDNYVDSLDKRLEARASAFGSPLPESYAGGSKNEKAGFGEALASQPPKGRVFVSNGKETLEIDERDVEAAKKDGFSVVGGR